MSHQRRQNVIWGPGCQLVEVTVLPALWMDSSPWNGHSLKAPTRAMDPPRIIFIDSTKPWRERSRTGWEDLPTPHTGANCFHRNSRVLPSSSPASSSKPSVQSESPAH